MLNEYLKAAISDNMTTKSLKRGQILYHEGDQPENVYFIQEGLIGLFHVSESGKETFLRVFGKDQILGHRSYFAQEPYHGSSMALAPTKVVVISKSDCDQVCKANPEMLKNVTSQLAKDLGNAEMRLAGLQDKTAQQRISQALIFLKTKYPKQTWTRKEIAKYAGSTFETVTRVMTSLEADGLIRKVGRDFEIVQYDELLFQSQFN